MIFAAVAVIVLLAWWRSCTSETTFDERAEEHRRSLEMLNAFDEGIRRGFERQDSVISERISERNTNITVIEKQLAEPAPIRFKPADADSAYFYFINFAGEYK